MQKLRLQRWEFRFFGLPQFDSITLRQWPRRVKPAFGGTFE